MIGHSVLHSFTRTEFQPGTSVVGIRVLGDLQTLMRILNVIAQRGIVPDRLTVQAEGEGLVVEMHLGSVCPDTLSRVLERLRAIVCVEQVTQLDVPK